MAHSPTIIPSLNAIERGNCGMGFVADRYGRPSHEILRLGIETLHHLEHRGALNADATTGDGAGVLTALPGAFFAHEASRLSGKPIRPGTLAVGVFFFRPPNVSQAQTLAEAALHHYGLSLLAWRQVPVNPNTIGDWARQIMPVILHALVERPHRLSPLRFEQQLFLARKQFERQCRSAGLNAYVPSFSARTIVYKGLLLAPQLATFYADLANPAYETSITVFHQRYSTNTTPSWERAQPFRVLGHNGEINTLQGNIAWMRSREPILATSFAHADELRPVIDTSGSDSAMLDNAAELLMQAGRSLPHAISMLVPQAWEKLPDLPQAVRDYYAYHACLTEPWDGPAALAFTDGGIVGASLDRNGLRPSRYLITDDGLVAAASEAGALPIDESRVILKGKLGPGQMLALDTHTGEFRQNEALKADLAARKPYGLWVRREMRHLDDVRPEAVAEALHVSNDDRQSLVTLQAAFGYTAEELVIVLRPMVEDAAEAIGSMGDDTTSAILSEKPRPLFGYFRQRFAEVTNPPIDPLREEIVMSLTTRIGARGNFLNETPEQAALLELKTPFLTDEDLHTLRADPALKAVTLSTLFPAPEGEAALEAALDRLCEQAADAVRRGSQLIILSDRKGIDGTNRGVDARHSFIPSLLAVSAVHHHLLRHDLRVDADIVVESGEPRETHHFATLIGYGAAAVNPYLALATAVEISKGRANRNDLTPQQAVANYLHALEHGLLKIMSKMGISTLDAYCGAQIFEVIGLRHEIVERYFEGTPHHLEGIGLKGIARIVLRWHQRAFHHQPLLDSPGFYKFKREGEIHAFSPEIVKALHAAVRVPGALDDHWEEGYALYQKYSTLQQSTAPVDLHDLLDFKNDARQPETTGAPSKVEPRQAIVRRLSTAAMSLGALSPEAHTTMALAMNRLGALSNSGEGGEAPQRYKTDANDRIKQVASARFGLTPEYLVSADELQIKMAQGSKPGEGGQLPGHKVTAEIAAIRHAQPGITLISPPPHHDIYSIEDLAQLIYDLRQINPRAAISVKLVAEAGVGIVAAGVAKAGADIILISGNSGGTGASPLSSIKYAGVPWEIGLAEAQHALVTSGLRGRVRLRTDGGLRTGRDVVIAAMLGADEYSFGTAAAVAEGCVMARACHLNTCPTGIATQRPDLRAKFSGTPEHMMAFMHYIAEEVRQILAQLGFASLEEIVGRSDLLRQVKAGRTEDDALDLSTLLLLPPGEGPRRYMGETNRVSRASSLNEQLIADCYTLMVALRQSPNKVHTHQFRYTITNRDRTFGARLAGEIARHFGDAGLPEGIFDIRLEGSAGQSFGAFGLPGLHLTLSGEANDYVGKGLGGGQIVVRPPRALRAEHPVLAGNTVLYGATGGEVFIAGRAGERFAVRNSGASAVVEGIGDHGCEYMTGGQVIVLGEVGYNFGAGMTGGVAYLYDETKTAVSRINPQMVNVERPTPEELDEIHHRISRHLWLTASPHGQALLNDWETAATHFLVVRPKGIRPPQDTTVEEEAVKV